MQGQTPPEAAGTDRDLSLGQRALQAFRRDLPRLLRERPGKWVLYHGAQLIGFAATPPDLHEECRRRGLRKRDCAFRCVEPEMPDIVDDPYPLD